MGRRESRFLPMEFSIWAHPGLQPRAHMPPLTRSPWHWRKLALMRSISRRVVNSCCMTVSLTSKLMFSCLLRLASGHSCEGCLLRLASGHTWESCLLRLASGHSCEGCLLRLASGHSWEGCLLRLASGHSWEGCLLRLASECA